MWAIDLGATLQLILPGFELLVWHGRRLNAGDVFIMEREMYGDW